MRSTKAQRFLVWVGLTLGVSVALAGSFLGESLNKTLGSVLIGFSFLIPSFWWMHCKSEDRKNNRHYQDTLRTNQDLSRYLAESDRFLLEGVAAPTAPRETDRRWPLVTIVSAGLMVLGALVASPSFGFGS